MQFFRFFYAQRRLAMESSGIPGSAPLENPYKNMHNHYVSLQKYA